MEQRVKYLYDVEVMMLMRQSRERMEAQGYEVDTRWIDYYGNECPRCGDPFKTYNNSIKGVGSISGFLIEEQKKFVPYSVCKSCAREVVKVKWGEGKTVDTEKRIFDKLPDLKRKDKNIPSEEEIQKEIEVLKKL